MAKKENGIRTSKSTASTASKQLRDGRTSKDAKTTAGSALVNRQK